MKYLTEAGANFLNELKAPSIKGTLAGAAATAGPRIGGSTGTSTVGAKTGNTVSPTRQDTPAPRKVPGKPVPSKPAPIPPQYQQGNPNRPVPDPQSLGDTLRRAWGIEGIRRGASPIFHMGGVDTGKTKPIDPAQSRAANARMRYINSISPGTSSETPKNPTEWGGAVRTKSMERGAERRDSLPGARGDLATGGSNQRGPKMGERGSPRKHFNIPGDRYGPPQTIGDSPLTDLIRHRKKLTGDERTRRAIERNKNDLRRGRIY